MKFGAKKLFKKELDVSLRAITSEICKKLTDDRIKHAPELYKIATSKIENKNLKKALESDVANDVADDVVEKTRKNSKKNRCKCSFWL